MKNKIEETLRVPGDSSPLGLLYYAQFVLSSSLPAFCTYDTVAIGNSTNQKKKMSPKAVSLNPGAMPSGQQSYPVMIRWQENRQETKKLPRSDLRAELCHFNGCNGNMKIPVALQ
ncbi:hypothetical protein AAES_51513 [Amazona aestiva]|uniref:Uncharacterized protein n=1 Tax=Amazona aestiva TaxID=12930 RepID=A0A0Q3UTW0_AMAAE|nr:hypothetical protein AAES_51513 [Amazona aestiva]